MKGIFVFACWFVGICVVSYAQSEQEKKAKDGYVFWKRVWPSKAPFRSINDAAGNPHPGKGVGAATWFKWGGAGEWKIFDVTKNKPLYIRVSGDNASIRDLKFILYEGGSDFDEDDEDEWEEVLDYEGPDGPYTRFIYHLPKAERLMFESTGKTGFYLRVYQLEKEKVVLTDRTKQRIEKYIERLQDAIEDDNQRRARRIRIKIAKMGPEAFGYLKQTLDSIDEDEDEELYRWIQGAMEFIGLQAKELKELISENAEELLDLLEEEDFDEESEPFQSLSLMGEYILPELTPGLKHEDEEQRLCIYKIASSIKSPLFIPHFIEALKDKEEAIRSLALKALTTITKQDLKGHKEWTRWWESNRDRFKSIEAD